MQKKATKVVKVPQGKLLRLDVEYDEKKITEIKITGDFFLHPENVIDRFENKIKMIPKDFDKLKLENTLNNILQENNAELIGVSIGNIVQTLHEAIQE